jgi:hypothetical protein
MQRSDRSGGKVWNGAGTGGVAEVSWVMKAPVLANLRLRWETMEKMDTARTL